MRTQKERMHRVSPQERTNRDNDFQLPEPRMNRWQIRVNIIKQKQLEKDMKLAKFKYFNDAFNRQTENNKIIVAMQILYRLGPGW